MGSLGTHLRTAEKFPVTATTRKHPAKVNDTIIGNSALSYAAKIIMAVLSVLRLSECPNPSRMGNAMEVHCSTTALRIFLTAWLHPTTQKGKLFHPRHWLNLCMNSLIKQSDNIIFETPTPVTQFPLGVVISHVNHLLHTVELDSFQKAEYPNWLHLLSVVSCGTVSVTSPLVHDMLDKILVALTATIPVCYCPEWPAFVQMLGFTFRCPARNNKNVAPEQLFPALLATTLVSMNDAISANNAAMGTSVCEKAILDAMADPTRIDTNRTQLCVVAEDNLEKTVKTLLGRISDTTIPPRFIKSIWIFEHGRHVINLVLVLMLVVIVVGIVSSVGYKLGARLIRKLT